MAKTSESKPAPEEIALLAYYTWEKQGKPNGQDMAIWLRAEQQLLSANKSGGQQFIALTKT